MRRLFLLVLIALPAALLPQQAGQSPHGSIQGVVRNSATGEGIPEVRVQVQLQTMAGPLIETVTDSGGRFQLTSLPLGIYGLRAERPGYVRPAELPVTSSHQVELHNRRPSGSVELALEPAAIISGRLLGPEGRPLPGMSISALRKAYRDGQVILQSRSTAQTDYRGDFRLSGLPAGRYYLRVDTAPTPGIAYMASLPQGTYYPGTTDWSRAIGIEIRAGQETGGIDFGTVYARGFTVSGSVEVQVPGGLISANGRLIRSVDSFYLIPKNAPAEESPRQIPNGVRQQISAENHFRFELHGIPPGSYDILPLFIANASPTANVPAGLAYSSVKIPVDVVDRDVTGLTGEIRTNPDLAVRVVMKSIAEPVTPPPSQLRLYLRPLHDLGLVSSVLTMGRTEGVGDTVVVSNVFPARYRINLLLTDAEDHYVADIRQGPASLYNDAIVTTDSEINVPVEIHVNSQGSRIRGTVRKAGQPVAARIVLIPEPPRRGNLLLYRQAVAANGEFLLRGIAPGEYRLFAWENLPWGAEEVPEIIRDYEARGKPVSIQQGSEIGDITLDVLPVVER